MRTTLIHHFITLGYSTYLERDFWATEEHAISHKHPDFSHYIALNFV